MLVSREMLIKKAMAADICMGGGQRRRESVTFLHLGNETSNAVQDSVRSAVIVVKEPEASH